jgi:hypothetical protein
MSDRAKPAHLDVWNDHIAQEFVRRDIEGTLRTMTSRDNDPWEAVMTTQISSFRAATARSLRSPTDNRGLRPVGTVLSRILCDILASPKGDLGGWEAGARGL